MSVVKRFVKNNPFLFATMKKGLLYVRYAQSLFETSPYKGLQKKNFLDVVEINLSGTKVAYLDVLDNVKSGYSADVCVFDLNTGKSKVVGHTTAWNWQQGCMVQWVNDTQVSYNKYNHESNSYVTVIVDVEDSAAVREINRSAYFFNSSHTKYLSLNFFRLDIYAKGYGYPYQVDSMEWDKDGIWEVNVESNTSKLILSLERVVNYRPKDYQKLQHYINHVAYTSDEKSIIFIHRWQVKGGEFVSRLLLYHLDTDVLETLLDYGHVSHYCWKNAETLFIYATNEKNMKGYMEVNIVTKKVRIIEGLPDEDGHPSFSQDKKIILTDTYPNKGRKQYVFLFDTTKCCLYVLDTLWSPFRYFNENRCDLHPRWSYDNKYVCVDNTASGFRSLKLYRVK